MRRDGATGKPTRGQPIASDVAEPEALVVTRWFAADEGGEPYAATVRFIGRRVGSGSNPRQSDAFVQDETIDGIVPGTGSVSITAWVYGLRPGAWTVDAELVARSNDPGQPGPSRRGPSSSRQLPRAVWSWRRWAVSAGPTVPITTRWALIAPLARSPAVVPGSYTVLAALEIFVGFAMQAAILAHEGVPVGPTFVVSILALVAGLIGAKVWSAILNPGDSILRGWAVDGFLVVFPIVAVGLLLAFKVSVGLFFDATAPGVFFAVAIGRLGCFLTGCCAGRCTGSRWGVWSSDRRIAARRIPTQLLESGAGLLLGAVTLLLVVGVAPSVHGAIFVLGFGAYAGIRQWLLRLRVERRRSPRSLPATAAAAAVVILVIGLALVVQGL